MCTRPRTVLVDKFNSIYPNRTTIQVDHRIGKSGSAISNMWKKFVRTHRSRDTAHAQCLQTHSQWYPVVCMGSIRIDAAKNV